MDRRAVISLVGGGMVAACLPSTGRSQPTPTRHHVKIWLRAFIPAPHPSLPGYVKKTDNGLQVIEAPWVPPVGDIGQLKGTCFTTDGRGFSSAPAASSRVTAVVELSAQGRNLTLVNKSTEVGLSHNVDCKSGVELRPSRRAEPDTIQIGDIRTSGFMKTLSVRFSSPNPFFKVGGISAAPMIDMDGVIQYDGLSRMLKVFGSTGYFPSFEVLSSIDGGAIAHLVRLEPNEGSTAIDLFDFGSGVNMRNFSASVRLA